MNRKWILLISLLICTAALVYGLSEQAHEFSSNDCAMCHIDAENDPVNIKPSLAGACESCHQDVKETRSHPSDIYATLPVPADMPLVEGRLTCITCHYVHPKKKRQPVERHYFLRRLVRGPAFCSICHDINEKGHIVLGSAHSGSYSINDRTASIDRVSLECIQCHDTYFKEPLDFVGAGTWEHSSKMSHPIGIEYDRASAKKMNDYRPAGMLRKEIVFFSGKIGCGTCHSMYSRQRNMLVMDNYRSRLCRECHLK